MQVSRTFTEFVLKIRNVIGWKFLMSNLAKNVRLMREKKYEIRKKNLVFVLYCTQPNKPTIKVEIEDGREAP